jgi:hypothetical protein
MHAIAPLRAPQARARAAASIVRSVLLAAATVAALAVATLLAARSSGAPAGERLLLSAKIQQANAVRAGRAHAGIQALAFGDAVRHIDTPAAQREGSVRRGIQPDFERPLGDLGSMGLALVDTTHAKAAAAAAAKAAAKAVASVNKTATPATGPGFVIASTDDRSDARSSSGSAAFAESKRAEAPTSKLAMGPAAFEAALGKEFVAAQTATPLASLAPGAVFAQSSKLDMMDEGDKDLQVATSIKSAVGDKTAEGSNLTSGEPASSGEPFATPDEMKAIEQVQAAVKAAADAEIDEAVASSKHAAMTDYVGVRDKFLEKEAANNVTGVLTYSASDEIYHDSNKFVKELKSLHTSGQYLSERPVRIYSVVVPQHVFPGGKFITKLPSGRRMLVTVPAHVAPGQRLAIRVPVDVGPTHSLAHERKQLRLEVSAAQQKRKRVASPPTSAGSGGKDAALMKERDLAAALKPAGEDAALIKKEGDTLATELERKFLAHKQGIEQTDDASALAAHLAAKEAEDRYGPAPNAPKNAFMPISLSASDAQESANALAGQLAAKIEAKFIADKREIQAKEEEARQLGLKPPEVKKFEEEEAQKQGKFVQEMDKETEHIYKTFLQDKALFDELPKPLPKPHERPGDARPAAAPAPGAHMQQSHQADSAPETHTPTTPSAQEEQQQRWSGAFIRRQSVGSTESRTTSRRSVVSNPAVPDTASQSADRAAHLPAARKMEDGDQRLRGMGGTSSPLTGAYWGAAAVDGAYYGVKEPSGLRAGEKLPQIPGGPEMEVTVPKSSGAGAHIAFHRPPTGLEFLEFAHGATVLYEKGASSSSLEGGKGAPSVMEEVMAEKEAARARLSAMEARKSRASNAATGHALSESAAKAAGGVKGVDAAKLSQRITSGSMLKTAAEKATSAKIMGKPALTKTVVNKEADIFSDSENEVDKLEEAMLKKVSRENQQRLKEEAAAKRQRLFYRPPQPAAPQKEIAHKQTSLSMQQQGGHQPSMSVREKWARKQWILGRVMPHVTAIPTTFGAEEVLSTLSHARSALVCALRRPAHLTLRIASRGRVIVP